MDNCYQRGRCSDADKMAYQLDNMSDQYKQMPNGGQNLSGLDQQVENASASFDSFYSRGGSSTNASTNYNTDKEKDKRGYSLQGDLTGNYFVSAGEENPEKARELNINQEEQAKVTFSIGGVELGGSLDNLVSSEQQRIERIQQHEH